MLKLAAIFKSHTVVRREKSITVFNTGDPGENICVFLSKCTRNAKLSYRIS